MRTISRTALSAAPTSERRQRIRYSAAAISLTAAIIYVLIGFEILSIVDLAPAGAPDLLGFGLASGAAFLLGAALLLATDRRGLWILGAAFQVMVIAMYFVVAEQRIPPFETWGILLKVLQVAILGFLVFLIVNRIGPTNEALPAEPPGQRPT